MTESMAAALKPWNIQLSLVEPGPVETNMEAGTPYGTHLSIHEDPYKEIFRAAGLMTPSRSRQQPEEVAQLVLEVIQSEDPDLRYQTADYIKEQAAKRLVDITGRSNVKELQEILGIK
jgi:NAD(P)-dependent dehydrogenase (short-subunit alcohol dehydrogenase family)